MNGNNIPALANITGWISTIVWLISVQFSSVVRGDEMSECQRTRFGEILRFKFFRQVINHHECSIFFPGPCCVGSSF